MALIGAGFSLVFGVMRIVNYAHGHFAIIASFVTFSLFTLYQIDPILSLLVTVPLLAGVLSLVYFAVRPLTQQENTEITVLLATLAFALFVERGFALLWGGEYISLPTGGLIYSQSLRIGSLFVSVSGLLIIVLSFVSISSLHLLLSRTQVGRNIRAVADNTNLARLCAISTSNAYLYAFALSGVMAALAGSAYVLLYTVNPLDAVTLTIQGFVVMVFSGTSKVYDVLLGGLILGEVVGFGQLILGALATPLILYSVFLLILLIRPGGLFARKG